ncbi:MAG: family 43 glycosylhydrolase [Clostridia bacterium]|nr:family 43 glycosylhydrolase [Clostridia bacterium]
MKKFLFFLTTTLVLFGAVFAMYMEYIHISEYPVFIESYEHGTVSVNAEGAMGNDSKYKLMCKKDSEITISVNPERTDSTFYNLEKLTVNGVDVTEQVNMLQYKTVVTQKLTVVATFKKGKRPESDPEPLKLDVTKPDIEKYADNAYLGSFSAYNLEDPTVFFDSESKVYYCFGSNNVVVRSTDLVNWTNRTTYFKHPENATSNTIMSFSQFESVDNWAGEHGYGGDESYTDKLQGRSPVAPEIVKVGDTYYMYFSIVKEQNANEAAIFCVKTDNLAEAVENKEWTDVGLVISTCGTNGGSRTVVDTDGNRKTETVASKYDAANAVHPSVVYDGKRMYMVYGGYYGDNSLGGEIYLVELNPETGLLSSSLSGDEVSTMHGSERFRAGTLVADPGSVPSMDRADGSLVSGAEIVYNDDNGYYYLFVTYGYDEINSSIVVSHSKDVAGPYVDFNGNDMASYSDNMFDKGYLLLAGYNFVNSAKGNVSYTDVGRASIGSPNVIKSDSGNWYIASQSQLYFKAETEIKTGVKAADEHSLMISAAPALEIRRLLWDDNGWPMALPEVYSGKSTEHSFKPEELYGNWDVIVLRNGTDTEDRYATDRKCSQIVSILEDTVISQSDINNSNALIYGGSFKQSGEGFTVTIDSVEFTVYPYAVWDWELKEGSIVFTGTGSDGTAIWAKKKLSTTMGLYTATLDHVYSKCEGVTAETFAKKLEILSANPSQGQIDACVDEIIKAIRN